MFLLNPSPSFCFCLFSRRRAKSRPGEDHDVHQPLPVRPRRGRGLLRELLLLRGAAFPPRHGECDVRAVTSSSGSSSSSGGRCRKQTTLLFTFSRPSKMWCKRRRRSGGGGLFRGRASCFRGQQQLVAPSILCGSPLDPLSPLPPRRPRMHCE